MFLDDTACNLASLNLLAFRRSPLSHRERAGGEGRAVQNRSDGPSPNPLPEGEGFFDVKAFEYATRLWTIVLEISVAMAAWSMPISSRVCR